MPFLLAEVLNFQCTTHLIGVGSLSQLIKAKPDGTSQIILDEEDSFWYQIDKIDGKWIYYQKGKDKYKIDEDGNNKSLLEKG